VPQQLTRKCVVGIESDEERCRALVEDSIALVTALVPALGYEICSRVAKQALAEKRRVADIVLEEKLLTPEQMSRLFCPDAMTAPARFT
jgi:aspartate ammonia-lyase